jgi:phenylacetaldehyde dehydrogenase
LIKQIICGPQANSPASADKPLSLRISLAFKRETQIGPAVLILAGLLLGELCQEAGLPDGVVNVLAGYGETAGAALAAHEDVDKIAFTGSTQVGKLIVKAAAGNLKKVTLELGGKSPVIVLDDADVELVVPGAAGAIFFNHGQCCCAGSRLMIHKKIFDKVVAGVADQAKSIKLGPGLDPETQMGPLVSDEQFKRVTGYIASGLEEGAEVVVGGKKGSENGGYFVQPTVLTKTKPDMKVVREEIFGPVVCAQPITDEDLEAIAREANNTPYGLAASVWGRNISKANKLAKRVRACTVWINCHNVFDASLPFGGYKQSGWGREMGEFVLNNYTEVKAVTTAL